MRFYYRHSTSVSPRPGNRRGVVVQENRLPQRRVCKKEMMVE